ncbi:hypothetical protein [Aureivirga marina]|uniref:hypothetical protein n=1 Tax=Aureivirga marina TaxID=1182451 RepID=UPI0018CB6092|nr:hypothetical protein [Aureivirga marina]
MESKFIRKNEELLETLDFNKLREKGISYLQEFVGEVWTDYNVHDPGVTILEQLIFSLTELAYKTEFDFKDLLASQKNEKLKNTFYSIPDIMTSNPITINDFRKIIVDQVEGIANIWIYPLNSFSNKKNIKGLYIAFVERNTYNDGVSNEALGLKVKKVLNFYSNLSEAFEEIIVLEKQEIYIQSDIEVAKNYMAEQIHAEILFHIERKIKRAISFYSLKEMQQQGYSISEIFEGPRLMHGFVHEKELKEKDGIFFNNQLIREIKKVDGVKAIKSFNILVKNDVDGKITYENYFDVLGQKKVRDFVIIKWNSYPCLGQEMFKNVNNENFIRYYAEDVRISLFQKDVMRLYNKLNAKIRLRYNYSMEQETSLNVPKGIRKPIQEYYSLQRFFPKIYGLTRRNLSDNLNKSQNRMVLQLKGFLLFFEQIINNYIAQLFRFTELYSLDNSVNVSYFTQIPWDVPEIHLLLKKHEDEDFLLIFEKSVKKIIAQIDDFETRRQKFLEHLLNRFGDDSYAFFIDKFNYYYKEKSHEKFGISKKIKLLENYSWISAHKSRGFDISKGFWKEESNINDYTNLSVVEKKIRILLGMEVEVEKKATILSPKVDFKTKVHAHDIVHVRIDVSNESVKGFWEADKEKMEQNEDLIKDIKIDEELFKRGIWEENFGVVKCVHEEKNQYKLLFELKVIPKEKELIHEVLDDERTKEQIIKYKKNKHTKPLSYLEFRLDDKFMYYMVFSNQNPDDTNPLRIWKEIASYESEEKAFNALKLMQEKLIKLNLDSETFYLVDHLQLRPKQNENFLNILLTDPDSDWTFRFRNGFKIGELHQEIAKEVAIIREHKLRVEKTYGKWRIVAKSAHEKLGEIDQEYDNKEIAEAKKEEVQQFFDTLSDVDVQNSNKIKFKRTFKNIPHLYEDYSFIITIFLSSWTARFSDLEFRHLLHNLFRRNIPAHICIQLKWISLEDMCEFEKLYSKWLIEHRKESKDFKILNSYSKEIMSFAKKV